MEHGERVSREMADWLPHKHDNWLATRFTGTILQFCCTYSLCHFLYKNIICNTLF